MRSSKLGLVAALLAISALDPDPRCSPRAPRERDQQTRKFTEARKAAAEAKRQRKAAKRLKEARHD